MENLNFLHFATMVMLTVTACIALSSFLKLGTIIGFIAAGVASVLTPLGLSPQQTLTFCSKLLISVWFCFSSRLV
ncbi:hypothetical protein JCM19233_6649 [Vibrio astriarenae]|nr:hypothetical protein JCM19233_6649 [Vibrio sp. C7]